MGTRAPLIVSLLLIMGMSAVSIWAWPLIPDSARIAIHWGADGQPNGFASKEKALLIGPVVGAVFTLLFCLLPFFTKRRANLAKSIAAYNVGWIGTLLMLTIVHILIVMQARGILVDVVGNGVFITALFMTAVGNFLGKTHPNPYVGIRTPWTRKSDYSWERTNRLAGRMFVAVGLMTLVALAVSDASVGWSVLLSGILIVTLVSVVLSYFYWKHDPEAPRDLGR
ncbi:MAG: SdpI family protein [Rhizomicrobium sp.]